MQLLKSGIESEISKTSLLPEVNSLTLLASSATLFRRNSVSTKLMAAYSKINGRKYLKDMLTPTLQNLYNQTLTFEVIDFPEYLILRSIHQKFQKAKIWILT